MPCSKVEPIPRITSSTRAAVVEVRKLRDIPCEAGSKLRPWLIPQKTRMYLDFHDMTTGVMMFITDGERLWLWDRFPYAPPYTWEEFGETFPDLDDWCIVEDLTRAPQWKVEEFTPCAYINASI